MECANAQSLTWMSDATAIDFIIGLVIIVTDIDGCTVVATEEEEEIYINTCILALICSIECVGGIECGDINHSKLVTRDLSRDVVASNEEIASNSCIIGFVDIL